MGSSLFSIIVSLVVFCHKCESLTYFRLETAVLPCDGYQTVFSQAIPDSTTVRWEGPDASVIINSTNLRNLTDARYTLNSSTYSLYIIDVDGKDNGVYRCITSGLYSNKTDVTTTPSAINVTMSPPAKTEYPIEAISNVTLEVKDPTPPSQPYAVNIKPNSVDLAWMPSDGPVKSYSVFYRSTGSNANPDNGTVMDISSSNTTIWTLTPFTSYIFKVTVTFMGLPYSLTSESDVIKTAPGSPTLPPMNVSVYVDGSQQINITWVPPPLESLQGHFRDYIVKFEWKGSKASFRTTLEQSYSLTGLKPYTTYTISVAVRNSATMAMSIGPYSEPELATTEEDVPTEPLSLRVFAFQATQFVILWGEPRDTNGVIVGYRVYIKPKEEDQWTIKEATQIVYAFSNRESFTTYVVKVSALTSVGEGTHSSVIMVTTDVAGASMPQNVAINHISNDSALITWSEPATYDKSIDAYVVEYWKADQLLNMTQATVEMGTSKILTNLRPSTGYYVKVFAKTKNIQRKPTFVDGTSSMPVYFSTLKNDDGNQNQGIPVGSRGKAGKVILIIFLILITVGVLAILYFGFVARKRQQMGLIKQQNGLRPVFAFSKPDELEEPPIPVRDFEEHVIVNHADSDGGFATEYEDIQAVGNNFPALAGLEDGNKLKNRYTNIVAYDHTRVHLQTLPGHPDSHYINSNYIDSYNQQCAYIATQGPLKNTIEDFWRMVWEQKCHVIVMITKLEERGRRKCERYWPPKGMAERFRDIEVSLDGKEKYSTYILRTFHLKYKPRRHGKAQERMVKHYHYIDWPDHGVPSHTLPVLDFVLRSSEANPQDGGPIIVHCSAGVGRTGTYIVIDSMLKQIKDCGRVNVFGFLKRIRTQRNYLVQTEEQYVFIHDVLLEWVKAGDTRIKVQDLKSYSEQMDLPDQNGIVYLDVQHQQITLHKIHAYQFMRARNPMNKPKNRNSQILPVERGRVTITGKPGIENSDYINASFLPGYWKKDAFIVTQYPLENTIMEFWKMLWENNCTTIVMLTCTDKENETIYWPTMKDDPMIFDCLQVTLLDEELSNINFVTRDFLIASLQDDDPLQIRQYSCTYWPDGCTPIHTTFDLIYAVEKQYKQSEASSKDINGPIVVHDKCGGRQAGTFCALLTLSEEMKEEESVNIYKTVKIYSATRVGMFKNKEDYHFLYHALSSAYTTQKQLLSIEKQKMANRNRQRRIHRDWSFMVRQPVTTMDFRPHVERRNSLDEEEFRGRSQTLGSTGRVARPTKFWHRRAKSEKRKPVIANGDAGGAITDFTPQENGQVQGEVYEIISLQSCDSDRMVDEGYPSNDDIENVVLDVTGSPDMMITAADLQKLDERERRPSLRSTDNLVEHKQEVEETHLNGEYDSQIPMMSEDRQMNGDINGFELNSLEGDEFLSYDEHIV